MPLRSWHIGLAIAMGAVGLALDFEAIAGTMIVGPQNPVARSFGNMLVYYWTFLTNLSNLALLLTYLSALTTWRWLGWFRHPVTRAGMAGIIALVMGFYHFMLAPALHDLPETITVSNILLHYCTPVLFLLWWLVFSAPRHAAMARHADDARAGPHLCRLRAGPRSDRRRVPLYHPRSDLRRRGPRTAGLPRRRHRRRRAGGDGHDLRLAPDRH